MLPVAAVIPFVQGDTVVPYLPGDAPLPIQTPVPVGVVELIFERLTCHGHHYIIGL
jgi:hypothetical protein